MHFIRLSRQMVIFRSCADNLLGGIWAMSSPHPKFLGGSSHLSPPLDYARGDAMRKFGHCCRPVSVRPSVTLVDCIHTAEDIVRNFFLGPVAPSFQFLTPSADTQFQGEPLQWSAKYTGWENFAIFDRNHRLCRKRYTR